MVLAFVEHEHEALSPASLEALTTGRKLARSTGAPLHAVMVGPAAPVIAGELRRYGVSNAIVITHTSLEAFAPEAWAASIVQVMTTSQPEAVLAGGTERGNEVMARVAAIASLPMAANCVELSPGPPFRVARYRWGSSLIEDAIVHGTPKILTLAPHVVEVEESAASTEIVVESFSPALQEKDFRVRLTSREETHGHGVNLKTATVVVGGGRGVGSAEGFRLLEELAGVLGGAVGGSRVATNNGWRPHSDQIGLTGNRIAPNLYIACGISGAIQHLVGCKGAKHVLVINKDPEAPFLRRADYGVVGDLHEIIPALIEEIRKAKKPGTVM